MARKKTIDIRSVKQRFPIGNKDNVAIRVLAIANSTNAISMRLRVGEFIYLHYFPTEISDNISTNWKSAVARSIAGNVISPIHVWQNEYSRELRFSAFFNEIGEDPKKFAKQTGTDSLRQGLLNVSESLQFLRDISSPQLAANAKVISSTNATVTQPPIIGIYGLLDQEVFIGILTNITINITHWLPIEPVSVTGTKEIRVGQVGKGPIRVPVSSVKMNALFRQGKQGDINPILSLSGGKQAIGFRPIRAKVDLSFKETSLSVVVDKKAQKIISNKKK